MDLVLLLGYTLIDNDRLTCFNPYFNGSSTSTIICQLNNQKRLRVSILILMDLVLLPDNPCNGVYPLVAFQSLF